MDPSAGAHDPSASEAPSPERTPGYEIRPLGTLDEYRACVALQEATWGHGFSERVSVAILKVSQRLGGVASGAWDASGRLVGFVFGMTGWEGGEPAHWSDMLAVVPALRDTGIGRTLKWHQRRVLLERGVKRMYWTFDPLVARNAHLNLNRLGVVIREYAVDMYGDTDSPLHRGIGTDRFVPVWHLDSERVHSRWEDERRRRAGEHVGAAAAAQPREDVPSVLDVVRQGSGIGPGEPQLDRDEPVLAVSVPSDIGTVQAASLETAVAWRAATQAVCVHYLGRGYEIRELVRGEPSSRYLMFRE